MKCQECKERQATLHFTKIVNGEKIEFHVCEVCAQQKSDLLPGMHNSFSIHNLLSGFLDLEKGPETLGRSQSPTLRCPRCGLTYSQFSSSGRFGCAECYEAFGERLEPVLSKVHSGNVTHQGKIPHRSGTVLKTKRELDEYKKKLKAAINNEAFEDAAELRDHIRKLEQELGGS
jgi:protein arginine kinase activator